MVENKTTGRWRVQGPPNMVSGLEDNNCQVIVENVGDTNFTVQLTETSDRTISGTRDNLGSAYALVPGGRRVYNVLPVKEYVEVKSTSGDGQLRLQLESKLRWNQLGFNDDDPFYPHDSLTFASGQTSLG